MTNSGFSRNGTKYHLNTFTVLPFKHLHSWLKSQPKIFHLFLTASAVWTASWMALIYSWKNATWCTQVAPRVYKQNCWLKLKSYNRLLEMDIIICRFFTSGTFTQSCQLYCYFFMYFHVTNWALSSRWKPGIFELKGLLLPHRIQKVTDYQQILAF